MHILNQETWSRKAHFERFMSYEFPHFGLCANVDITVFMEFLKKNGLRFYVPMLYAATRAANQIPAFRYRIRGKDVVVHDVVHPSSTLLLEDDTFCYAFTPYEQDFLTFVKTASALLDAAKDAPTVQDEPSVDDRLYFTSLPWVSFTGIMHPMTADRQDSVPRLAFGKFFEQGGKMYLPVSVQAHHALMDGVHLGQFYTQMQELLNHPKVFL